MCKVVVSGALTPPIANCRSSGYVSDIRRGTRPDHICLTGSRRITRTLLLAPLDLDTTLLVDLEARDAVNREAVGTAGLTERAPVEHGIAPTKAIVQLRVLDSGGDALPVGGYGPRHGSCNVSRYNCHG